MLYSELEYIRCNGAELDFANAVFGGGSSAISSTFASWVSSFQLDTGSDLFLLYSTSNSGTGKAQLLSGFVDFALSESAFTEEELEVAGLTLDDVVQKPLLVLGVTPIFNLPGIPDLVFSRDVLIDIFTGRITNWGDSALVDLNPGVALPSAPIR